MKVQQQVEKERKTHYMVQQEYEGLASVRGKDLKFLEGT